MTINDRILVAQDSGLLPNSTLSLEEARHLLGTRHLMKEQLTKGEREILYAAESLLRYVGDLREECVRAATTRDQLGRDLVRLRGCIEGATIDEVMQNINHLRAVRATTLAREWTATRVREVLGMSRSDGNQDEDAQFVEDARAFAGSERELRVAYDYYKRGRARGTRTP